MTTADVHFIDSKEPPAAYSYSVREPIHQIDFTGDEPVYYELRWGRAVYRFSVPLNISATWAESSGWRCRFREFGASLDGLGTSRSIALDSLHKNFHIRFQQLYAMRYFEMQEKDRSLWGIFQRHIDWDDYRTSTPIRLREIGCVRFGMLSYPSQMRWLDGRNEPIDLNIAPANLAGFQAGQWIEATVERNHKTGQLKRIVDCEAIATPPSLTAAQAVEYFQRLPVADLPRAD